MATRALVAICVFLAASAITTKVTPVQKVTELLKKLQAQIAEEGKKEAAQYDKYACFCKEQADDKKYAIDKSVKLEEELSTTIEKLGADISNLGNEIGVAAQGIFTMETKHKQLTTTRESEHQAYLTSKKNLKSGILAVEGALETLKSAKGELSDAKLTGALVQVKAYVGRLASEKLERLARSHGPGDAAKYQYHSNDIISTLESILDTFKVNLKDMEETEFKSKAEYESEALGITNQVKFMSKDKAEKEELNAAKDTEKAEAQEAFDQEQKDRNADQKFLDELTEDCQKKADLFDQRSSTRGDELKAIAGAIEQLETVAMPKYEANSKLVALQKSANPHIQHTMKTASVPTLLQLHRVRNGQTSEAVIKTQAFLATASSRLRSSILSAAAIKVLASKDHFVKVRQLIKDLIAKLEADAASEADQKGFCDKAMKSAIGSRDKANADIEKATSAIAMLTEDIDTLESEIKDLNIEIADDTKALSETSELRQMEAANNEKTVADAKEGKTATELALQLLTDFYEGATGFLQKASYVPENADREGNSLEDVRPEVFDEKYHGKQTESTGIIGMLQVIAADFDRTIQTTTSSDKEADSEYKKFQSTVDQAIKDAEESKSSKETSVVNKESEKKDEEESKANAEKSLESALAELETLKVSCVDAEETFDDRKKKREQEIAALKEAMQILIEWQN